MNQTHRKAFSLLGLNIALSVLCYHSTVSVGLCSFPMYLYKTRMFCEVPFYHGLRMGLTNNCRPLLAINRHKKITAADPNSWHASYNDNFETLISCIKNVTRVCEYSWRQDAWIDLDVRLKFRKRFYCHNGALVMPVPLAICGQNKRGKQCLRNFHAKFRNNISDTTLCEEYSKAKNCVQELLEKECPEHVNSRSYYMDVLFDNYNPFCKTFLYNAPTTVTTPPRKTERLVMTHRREPSSRKSSPRATAIVKNSARSNREKSSLYISLFELWFVLSYS